MTSYQDTQIESLRLQEKRITRQIKAVHRIERKSGRRSDELDARIRRLVSARVRVWQAMDDLRNPPTTPA